MIEFIIVIIRQPSNQVNSNFPKLASLSYLKYTALKQNERHNYDTLPSRLWITINHT